MSDTARALGMDGMIDYEGEKYRLAENCLGIRADMCLWIEERDRQAIVRCRFDMDPADYKQEMRSFITDIKDGIYEFYGEYIQDQFSKQAVIEHFVYLQLKYGNPDKNITEDLASQIWQKKSAEINQINEMRAQEADPTKATAQATSTS